MGLRIAACVGWLSVIVAPLLGACTAEVNGAHSSNGAGGTTTTSAGGASTTGGTSMTASCTQNVALANARIWRITDAQYVNTVRQVFGVTTGPEVTEVDSGAADYTNFSELTLVNDGIVGKLQSSARDVARQAVKSHFDKFMACGTTDACAEQFVRNRIARAFGRRLEADEVSGYIALFHKGAEVSPQDGVRLMIEAALQSPSFIYRTELGAPKAGGPVGQVPLTSHEIATMVSMSLTNSVPDDQLWQKADTGALADPAVLAAEVDRLLDLPETKANLSQLASYWLGVEKMRRSEKDTAQFPEFTPDLKATMYKSAQLFVQDILATGTVNDLVTSKKMYVNDAMAMVFGIPGVTGADLKPVDVTLPERSNGILTQPGVLAAYARPTRGDPIHRGLFGFYALACGGSIPAPPANALDVAKTFPANATERELAGLRAANPLCNACHSKFDSMGLITERYDPIGRYHETDAKGPIDQSSTLVSLGPDLDGPVDGIPAFVSKLIQGRRLADCAAQNLAVFTLGRDVRGDTSCAFQGVKDALAKSGKFRDFYKALVTSPAFVLRDVQ
jgi:hypothetical protein